MKSAIANDNLKDQKLFLFNFFKVQKESVKRLAPYRVVVCKKNFLNSEKLKFKFEINNKVRKMVVEELE